MRDTSETKPKVLCVDDDPEVLDGLRRVLWLDYDVVTQTDPLRALTLLQSGESFDVILSDLKMGPMEGTRFLAHAKRVQPSAVRLLLTGVPDLASAISAINDGAVFRFLVKPCPGEQLLDSMRAAVLERQRALEVRKKSSGDDAPSGPARARRSPAVRGHRSPALPSFAPPLASPRRPVTTSNTPHVAQSGEIRVSSGSVVAGLARVAERALDEGRARDAERALGDPLRALLREARAGKPIDADEAGTAAVLAARLATLTRSPGWIDYPFLLFGALRRLLPSAAIDEIQAALQQVRGANVEAFQLYLSVLAFHGRALSPTERCLLRRIQQCRALMALAV